MAQFQDPSLDESREFHFDVVLSGREVTYSNPAEAVYSPLAKKLFGFPWTEKVTIGKQFVRVHKASWVEWDVLEAPLKGLVSEHVKKVTAATGATEENQEPPKMQTEFNDELSLGIQSLLEGTLNPALAQHGGSVRLMEVRGSRAYVLFEGGCQGCAMSTATLKEGVERAILHAFPEIQEVVDATNHLAGENPYYSS
jgi:Fe-S cluster biogenesis protein NfuA